MPSERRFTLVPHPFTSCEGVATLIARVRAARDDWQLRYTLGDALAQVRVPPRAGASAAADGLWRHTCFELFVGPEDSTAYHEFNFSPSGDWAAYCFSDERVRADGPPLPAPRIECRQTADELAVDVWLPIEALPARGVACAVGLSAVIESTDGHLSNWALHHPKPVPDFHDRAGWVARLSASGILE